MAGFLLLILCLNIDALSFGVAYGLKKTRFSFWFVLKISFLSTFFFAVPLFLSQFVFKYFNRQVCNIINGIILIILGCTCFIKNSKQNSEFHLVFSHKKFFGECFAFSVDAIFSAFLGGFPMNFYIFFVIFYFFSNFLAIFLGNLILFKLNSKIKLRLDFFGGIIFIVLGITKMFGI